VICLATYSVEINLHQQICFIAKIKKKNFASSQESYLEVGIKQTANDMLLPVAANISFELRKTDTL
jgi:RNA polymerase-interacting CarD/CdnL/TRCF family regulator